MNLKYSAEPPEVLIQRLKPFGAERDIRRRAVLLEVQGAWTILLCTVEASIPSQRENASSRTLQYGNAILFEDWLTGEEALRFVESLSTPRIHMAGVTIQRGPTTQWTSDWLAANNDYMARSGQVCTTQYAPAVSGGWIGQLLSPSLPFYPDIESAVRSWLPLRRYHGPMDARHGGVLFFLPEIRAYFAEVELSNLKTPLIHIEGTQRDSLCLLIKGAFWDEEGMHQIEASVNGTTAHLPALSGADRVECYLIDLEGNVYDFHQEDRYTPGLGDGHMWCLPDTSTRAQIDDACAQGEGLHIEFKPFVDPAGRLISTKDGSKLREVIETAVAFANTEGGILYLGIDDYCSVEGVNQGLAKYYQTEVRPDLVDKYLVELKRRIKNEVASEIVLRLSHLSANDRFVVVISVERATRGVTVIRDDPHYYVRRGASTTKLPADQWAAIRSARIGPNGHRGLGSDTISPE